MDAIRASMSVGHAGLVATMKKTLRDDGWLHISFYVHGHSHGGIYFGESGSENTILRNKGWSDFSSASPGKKPEEQSAASNTGGSDLINASNLAILAYLGNPVPAPADLDARYSRSNLLAAFTALSKKANWRVKMLNVDESEFPFLTYGVLEGDFRVLENGLRGMKGYGYGGSVSGHTHDGGTYFALNMVPQDQYPSGSRAACNRRLMVRLQMLADTAWQSE